ncbi:MAG: hypothetical protein ACJ735_12565 [Actinomycetes bacterium]
MRDANHHAVLTRREVQYPFAPVQLRAVGVQQGVVDELGELCIGDTQVESLQRRLAHDLRHGFHDRSVTPRHVDWALLGGWSVVRS